MAAPVAAEPARRSWADRWLRSSEALNAPAKFSFANQINAPDFSERSTSAASTLAARAAETADAITAAARIKMAECSQGIKLVVQGNPSTHTNYNVTYNKGVN
jgi:hypothetical protein